MNKEMVLILTWIKKNISEKGMKNYLESISEKEKSLMKGALAEMDGMYKDDVISNFYEELKKH